MAQVVNYKYCICCGSAAIGHVLTCRDFTVSNQFFEVWECSNCTLRFTQNVPDKEGIVAYYRSADYISHSDTQKGVVNFIYHRVRSFTLKQKRQLLKKITGLHQGTLLDVGSGTGAFVQTMRKAGWKVTGVEPDETARLNSLEKGHELLGMEAVRELEPETMDAITLWHVLEHVHDLREDLKIFHNLLKNSGKLFIAVPNYNSVDAQVYGENWAAYDVPRHLYHFSPLSLDGLLHDAGFEIELMRPMWFDSFYISMLSERYATGKTRFFQAFITGLLSNFKALFNVGKCSSVIYIIRKSA